MQSVRDIFLLPLPVHIVEHGVVHIEERVWKMEGVRLIDLERSRDWRGL